jgi:VWFA-related protein
MAAIKLFVIVTLVSIAFQQYSSGQQSGQTSTPSTPPSALPQSIPDFSRIPDPSLQTNIQFQGYEKTPLKFSTTVRYVMVPVIVTGSNGKAVKGLTKEAFRLFENGKERPIASFEAMQPSEQPIHNAVAGANEFTNQLALNDNAPRRLVIIAFDLVNTPIADQAYARRQLISYLSQNLDPNCLYQLVAIESDGLHLLYDFTQDTAGLIQALQQVQLHLSSKDKFDMAALSVGTLGGTSMANDGGPMTPGQPISTAFDPGPTAAVLKASDEEMALSRFALLEVPYSQYVQGAAASTTLDAFQRIAFRVSGIPGRKSLVWITGAFPFSLDPSNGSVDVGTSFAAYQHVMQLLTDQLVAVYPVDARGLLVLQPDADTQLSRSQLVQINALLSNMANRNRDIQETMRAFAEMTGGRAYINRNDVDGAVREAANDGSAYYLLSFAVNKDDKRQGWRKIKVEVGNYNVRARKGYYMTQTTEDPQVGAKADIDSALTSPFDSTGLPLRLVLTPPEAASDKKKLAFTVLVPPNVATVAREDDNHMNLEIAYRVWNASGQDAGHKGAAYNLKLNATQLEQITKQGVGYGDALTLAPGAYTLRVVVRDQLNGRIGSVSAAVKVN